MDKERSANIILKEQWQLVQAQKEIDKMIQLINECLNEFLVENLQLKSNEVAKLVQDPEEEISGKPPCDMIEDNEINKQSLNLNVEKAVKSEYIEEEEEDEDEDDEISTLSFL